MPEQLTFELVPDGPPSFASFVVGRNPELVDALGRVARGEARETGLLVWGAPGAGKSHLLQATVRGAEASGRTALYCATQDVPEAPPGPRAIVAVDDVDRADVPAQARLFTLFNALAASAGQLVCAAAAPPAKLPLREDLRTRLGWGLVYEALALTDAEKVEALAAFAHQRGFALPADVATYLLAHVRRDMSSLLAAVAALDRHSLAVRRPVTLALLREWLQRQLGLRD